MSYVRPRRIRHVRGRILGESDAREALIGFPISAPEALNALGTSDTILSSMTRPLPYGSRVIDRRGRVTGLANLPRRRALMSVFAVVCLSGWVPQALAGPPPDGGAGMRMQIDLTDG